ncbi:MAG: prenyltransferase [Anaerolineae bacterium]|nr:prenyltransferase [Anaerolineae bacterium]
MALADTSSSHPISPDPERTRAIRFIKYLLFSASIIPALVAGAMALGQGKINWLHFALVALGLLVGQASGDYFYFYFTHFHTDQRDAHTKIFAGWKPFFTPKPIPGKMTVFAGVACLGLDLLIGIYFYRLFGAPVLVLAAMGGVVAVFFTPLMLRGLKEPVVFMTFGPLSMLGVYYVLTGQINLYPLVASLPVGFLVTLVAYLKSARFEVQEQAGEAVVLKINPRTIRLLLMLAYISLGMAALAGQLPWWSLLGLLTVPAALKLSNKVAVQSKVSDYLWATVNALWIFIATGGLLALGFLLDGWL